MKRLILALVLTSPVLFLGCPKPSVSTPAAPSNPDTPYIKVSQALLKVAQVTGNLEAGIITANSQKFLTDDKTKQLLTICSKVNTFVGQASALIRGQVALAPADGANLLGLIAPILSAFQADMDQGLVGITDPATRNTVSVALITIQTALSGIQVAIA